jgi:hypothetical protein
MRTKIFVINEAEGVHAASWGSAVEIAMAGRVRENGSGTVRAFLKRRWLLVAYGYLLVAASACDVTVTDIGSDPTGFGIVDGDIFYHQTPFPHWWHSYEVSAGFGVLKLGSTPKFGLHQYFVLPIWIPLSAVLGWMAVRELRWRGLRGGGVAAAAVGGTT